MSRITIEVESASPHEAFDIDPLGVTGINVLADLFPGVVVVGKYRREEEYVPIPGVKRIAAEYVDKPGLLRYSFLPVETGDGWWREISLFMRNESQVFLGIGSDAPLHALGPGRTLAWRPNLPEELEYAAAICEDVSRAWTLEGGAGKLREMTLALCGQLSQWIVCHIVADLFYPFPSYGKKNSKHDSMTMTLSNTISYLQDLATTRVEHQDLSHGILIAKPSLPLSEIAPGVKYPKDFRDLKRSPLLSDGIRGALCVSPNGVPFGWISSDWIEKQKAGKTTRQSSFASLSYLVHACRIFRGVAAVLRKDGSIVLFAKGRPLFLRRGGKWRGLLWNTVRTAVAKRFGEIGGLVWDAALILSTTGQGGMLAIVATLPVGVHEKDRVEQARRNCDAELRPLQHQEWLFHRLLPSTDVLKLGSTTIATLASIDGATIVSQKGQLLAYGAVVPSSPSGSEGARSAAARSLSANAFVVKVSADGAITIFQNGAETLEV